MDQKNKIIQFLKTPSHMTIATVNGNNLPEAAMVGFAENNDLTLIFGTDTTTRKYHNIKSNNNVAIVFGDEETTVQYEGKSLEFQGDELEAYKQIYFKKTPSSKKYEYDPNQIYLKVTPKWIRYTDFSKDPADIFEMTF